MTEYVPLWKSERVGGTRRSKCTPMEINPVKSSGDIPTVCSHIFDRRSSWDGHPDEARTAEAYAEVTNSSPPADILQGYLRPLDVWNQDRPAGFRRSKGGCHLSRDPDRWMRATGLRVK